MENILSLPLNIVNNNKRINYINSYSGCFYSMYIIKKLFLIRDKIKDEVDCNVNKIIKNIKLNENILEFPFCGLYKIEDEIYIPELKLKEYDINDKINLYNNLIKYKIYSIIRNCLNTITLPVYNRNYIKNELINYITNYKKQYILKIIHNYDELLLNIENTNINTNNENKIYDENNIIMINFLYNLLI